MKRPQISKNPTEVETWSRELRPSPDSGTRGIQPKVEPKPYPAPPFPLTQHREDRGDKKRGSRPVASPGDER